MVRRSSLPGNSISRQFHPITGSFIKSRDCVCMFVGSAPSNWPQATQGCHEGSLKQRFETILQIKGDPHHYQPWFRKVKALLVAWNSFPVFPGHPCPRRFSDSMKWAYNVELELGDAHVNIPPATWPFTFAALRRNITWMQTPLGAMHKWRHLNFQDFWPPALPLCHHSY